MPNDNVQQIGKPSQECEFEISPYVCSVTGEIKATVYEVGGTDPTGIIQADQDWYVLVEFRLTGPIVHHLCGKFCVCLHIECFGPGPEETLPCVYADMEPCKPEDEWYEVKINVPAGTIPGAECGQVCCLAVTLTSFDPCDNPGHIAAYCRGPCIMFYTGA